MRALDTNVLIRLLVRDDEQQFEISTSLLTEPFIILPTVLLEAVWVLSSRYGFTRERIIAEIDSVLAHDNARVVSDEPVALAIDRYRSGGGFADHLHFALAGEAGATRFATFDRKIRSVNASRIELETLG